MKNMIYIFTIFCLFSSCQSCQTSKPTQEEDTTKKQDITQQEEMAPESSDYDFPYKLNKPDKSFTLPPALTEISGLGLSADGKYLLAINDEEGKVFKINKSDGAVVNKTKFAKKGDYEGIEQVGEQLFVVQNNGTIFEVEADSIDEDVVEKYNTPLHAENDIEGLGYDPVNNYLLLAAKAKSGVKKHKKHQRAIFAFNLNKMKLKKKPLYLIDRDDVEAYLEKNGKGTKGLLSIFAPSEGSSAFAPSAIAVHPQSKDIYILSSVGKLLLVWSPEGKILYIEELKKKIYKQPEGICFDSDGTLYISTEGKGGYGEIFKLNKK